MFALLLWITFLTACYASIIISPVNPLRCDQAATSKQRCFRGQNCSVDGLCQIVHDDSIQYASLFSSGHGPDPVHEPPKMKKRSRLERFLNAPQNAQTTSSSGAEAASTRKAGGVVKAAISEPVLHPPTGSNVSAGTKTQVFCNPDDTVPCHACCSAYGFCGSGLSFCGYGCQSGQCMNPKDLPVLPLQYPNLSYAPGIFRIVGQSGVPAMGAALMPTGNPVFTDKVENYTQLLLDNGRYAFSAEYDLKMNIPRPLYMKTNPFCSGGIFLADGRLLSIGGNGPLPDIDPTVGDGFRALRYLERTPGNESGEELNWQEPGHLLSSARWYPSALTMPDKRIFVVSGSLNGLDPIDPKNNNPTYEMLDESGHPEGPSIILPILERNQPYYMYPFLHLLNDGNVFIFVARSAEIFDVFAGITVENLPDLPGDYRTYPNTGGSVLLPLKVENDFNPEVMVCGGGPYQDINAPTDPTCGRIRPLSPSPQWELELMPQARGMVEGVLLPDGKVLWINGAQRGSQGFGLAKDPGLDAWIYDAEQPLGARWTVAGTSKIPRLYHSVALLLLDGTVLLAGSNPNEQPLLEGFPVNPSTAFETEFRVEIYTPPYLAGDQASRRPTDVWISRKELHANGSTFRISFSAPENAQTLQIALYHGGFSTHSVHMGQRLIFLDSEGFHAGWTDQVVTVSMPPSRSIAPPGPYVIYVVVDGIPSIGQFVMVK